MPVLAYIIGSVGVAAVGLGYFAKESGQAVNNTGDAAIKAAAAGLVMYIVLKKAKVI